MRLLLSHFHSLYKMIHALLFCSCSWYLRKVVLVRRCKHKTNPLVAWNKGNIVIQKQRNYHGRWFFQHFRLDFFCCFWESRSGSCQSGFKSGFVRAVTILSDCGIVEMVRRMFWWCNNEKVLLHLRQTHCDTLAAIFLGLTESSSQPKSSTVHH